MLTKLLDFPRGIQYDRTSVCKFYARTKVISIACHKFGALMLRFNFTPSSPQRNTVHTHARNLQVVGPGSLSLATTSAVHPAPTLFPPLSVQIYTALYHHLFSVCSLLHGESARIRDDEPSTPYVFLIGWSSSGLMWALKCHLGL